MSDHDDMGDADGKRAGFGFGDLRAVLRRHGIRPRKGLGQHFLADSQVLARIVAAADLTSADTVLEVGPGPGLLTAGLAASAGRVVAVEIDPDLGPVLADTLAGRDNVELVTADILAVDPGTVLGLPPGTTGRLAGYKVVANLPYHVGTAVLRHLLEAPVRPELAVVMLQREVGERILAAPGDSSVLSVAVQLRAKPSRVTVVPPRAFVPPPKVDSMVLRLEVLDGLAVAVTDVEAFFRVVRAGFGQRRKQLRNSVSGGLGIAPAEAAAALTAAGIDPRRRAQTLTLDEWAALTKAVEDTSD